MSYGKRLKEYRLLRKLSQEAFAEQTGVPMTAISKIEHGSRNVTLDEAVRFAEVLRISLAQLAGLPESGTSSSRGIHTPIARCVKNVQKELNNLVSAVQQLDTFIIN